MKVLYKGKEIELDDEKIEGKDEFDTLEDLEKTIEIDSNKIKDYGEKNG